MIGGAVKKLAVAVAVTVSAVTLAMIYPAPLFAYSQTYGAFTVRSDRPIDPTMGDVIADAERRLKSSELYDEDKRFRLFICNEPWRLLLLARNPSVGGQTDTLVTRNIYIREADPASNRVLIGSATLADAADRPLSYFIAHEAAHAMQSRRFGRFLSFRYPRWLVEGHADLVAKGGRFDMEANRGRLREQNELLSEASARRGLYRRYHLMVAAVLQQTGATPAQLFANPPSEESALRTAYTWTPARAS